MKRDAILHHQQQQQQVKGTLMCASYKLMLVQSHYVCIYCVFCVTSLCREMEEKRIEKRGKSSKCLFPPLPKWQLSIQLVVVVLVNYSLSLKSRRGMHDVTIGEEEEKTQSLSLSLSLSLLPIHARKKNLPVGQVRFVL